MSFIAKKSGPIYSLIERAAGALILIGCFGELIYAIFQTKNPTLYLVLFWILLVTGWFFVMFLFCRHIWQSLSKARKSGQKLREVLYELDLKKINNRDIKRIEFTRRTAWKDFITKTSLPLIIVLILVLMRNLPQAKNSKSFFLFCLVGSAAGLLGTATTYFRARKSGLTVRQYVEQQAHQAATSELAEGAFWTPPSKKARYILLIIGIAALITWKWFLPNSNFLITMAAFGLLFSLGFFWIAAKFEWKN